MPAARTRPAGTSRRVAPAAPGAGLPEPRPAARPVRLTSRCQVPRCLPRRDPHRRRVPPRRPCRFLPSAIKFAMPTSWRQPGTAVAPPRLRRCGPPAKDDKVSTIDLPGAASWLTGVRHLSVLTGAGISTDSGIPDFRGPSGVWTKDPAAERMSTYEAYVADPAVRKRSWQNRLAHPAWAAEPNAGHVAIARIAGSIDTWVITQNIDGLHQR